MSAAPVTPLPSSTVILLREEHGAEPFSVLMLKRHGRVTFPGVHAFPGGVVDPHDVHAPGAAVPSAQRWAPDASGDQPHEALPYWIAAVRELFEEVGILLARAAERLVEGPLPPELRALRPRLDGRTPFSALLAPHGLVPATDGLYYFARWITPRVNPRRFDTRFLVGRVPRGQEPIADGTEAESCEWLTPHEALLRYLDGAIDLIPPTVSALDDLARFPSIDAVLDHASRRVIRAASPDIEVVDGVPTMSYPSAAGDDLMAPRRLVLRDGRWRPADG